MAIKCSESLKGLIESGMDGYDYAQGENWDAQQGAQVLSEVIALMSGELDEPEDRALLSSVEDSLITFIQHEKQERDDLATQADDAPDPEDSAMMKVAARTDINPKEGTNQYGKVTFADAKNKKYPIDTAEHIRAAWSYIHQDKNRSQYSVADAQTIEDKIAAAWRSKIDKAGPPAAQKKNAEVKIGARNSAKDSKDIQTVHDAAQRLGAQCDADNAKSIEADELLFFGESIKAVKMDDGSVKLGGYLVRYGSKDTPDITGEFFTKDTDFGDAEKATVYLNHRYPVKFGNDSMQYKEKLGKATLTKDDAGVYAEILIGAHNEYEKAIAEAGLAGKLGWSSGTAGHLVDREQVGKAVFLKSWPLGLDASLTPTPAEYRSSNQVIPLKSFSVISQASGKQDGQDKPKSDGAPEIITIKNGDVKMEMTKEQLQELVEGAADKAVKGFIDKYEPTTKSGVKVTRDAADQPWGALPEEGDSPSTKARKELVIAKSYFMAVKNAGNNPHNIDPRLLAIKAPAGSSEQVPSDGGFLLLPTLADGIVERMYSTGTVLSGISKDSVGDNSSGMLYNGIDETSRADGSRWGGIQGYWLAEAGSLTGSKAQVLPGAFETQESRRAGLCD